MKVLIGEKEIVKNLKVADSIWSRFKGLMFSSPMPNGEGLLIDPCNSIHTCFMKYDLDVVFLSRDLKVVKIIRNIKPWRMTWIYFKASKVLEMKSGDLPQNISVGEQLEVVCTN